MVFYVILDYATLHFRVMLSAKAMSIWAGSSRLNKALSVILITAILAAIGALIYMAVVPKVGEKFTEFYILGPEGKAENYPTEVVLRQEAEVILGIVNHEYEEVSYRVEVRIGGVTNKEIGPVVLTHEEKWEQEVSFTPSRVGENQKVEFLLYKRGHDKADLTLRLWIDVKEQ